MLACKNPHYQLKQLKFRCALVMEDAEGLRLSDLDRGRKKIVLPRNQLITYARLHAGRFSKRSIACSHPLACRCSCLVSRFGRISANGSETLQHFACRKSNE